MANDRLAQRKGASYTTGTVHYARTVHDKGYDAPRLVQACGMHHRQHAYLMPVDETAEVTCRRCGAAAKPKPRKLTQYAQGYQDALADLARELDEGGEAAAHTWLANNRAVQ